MFDLRRLKPVIEGGGTYPSVKYDKNDIATVTANDIYLLLDELIKDPPSRDLDNRRFNGLPFHKNGKSEVNKFIATIATESADNVNRYGEIVEGLDFVPFNINADYKADDGESYGVMQIDVTQALPYVLMMMSDEWKDELNALSQQPGGVKLRNDRANEIYADEITQNKVKTWLKDPNTIRDQLLIAATLYNYAGLDAWNAWTNYNSDSANQGFKDLFEQQLEAVNKAEWQSYKEINNKELQKMKATNTSSGLSQIIYMIDKLPANIEEAAKELSTMLKSVSASGTASEYFDEEVKKLEPFMRKNG